MAMASRLGAWRAVRRRRTHRGAAAVEFALISVILFPILLGIIDYGLYFNDSLNARQGVRESARQGVVINRAVSGSGFATCGSASNDIQRLACNTVKQVGAISGTAYAMVKTTAGTSPAWAKGNPLLVCTMIKSTGVTGITPLPGDRIIQSKTQMSIEVATPIPTGFEGAAQSYSTGTPSGANWNWCT